MAKKILKLLLINGAIVFAGVLCFSDLFLAISIGSSVFSTVIGIAIIILLITIFFKSNSAVLNGKKTKEKIEKTVKKELVTDEDFKMELMKCMAKREFKQEAELAIKQIERLRKKIDMLDLILVQHFSKSSLTYEKFHSTVLNIEDLFFENLRKMILKINIFDQDEYNNMARENRKISTEAALQRNAIFKEYINYANGIIEKNENILIKLDNLMLEISKLEDMSDMELENLATIQEMNSLIDQTKLYKQGVQS